MEINAAIPNKSYRYFYPSYGKAFFAKNRAFSCKKLINNNDASKQIVMNFIRNTWNIPNNSDLFNIFGLGGFYGATGDSAPDRVLMSQWQSTSLNSALISEQYTECDMNYMYVKFNMDQQYSTQINYFGFPDIEEKIVSQIAIAIVSFQFIFNAAFLKRGLKNIAYKLAIQIELQTDSDRDHANTHIKRRAENIDKLEELYDLILQQDQEALQKIKLDDKKQYFRKLDVQQQLNETESAMIQIDQFGTNWHFYKQSHQIQLLEEIVLHIIRQQQHTNVQIKKEEPQSIQVIEET